MATARNPRGVAAGAIGSVVLTAVLSPVAFAGTPGGTGRTPGAAVPRVVVSLDADALSLSLDDGADAGPGSSGTPGAVDLELGPEAKTVVPQGDRYAFLGSTGDPVWMLDGSSSGPGRRDEIPQWDTTGVPADELADGKVEWEFTGVEGPGDVIVFAPHPRTTADPAATAPEVLFDSADDLPDAQALPAGGTGDVAWAFTRPGRYRLTSRATARLADGRTTTATRRWTVRVTDDTDTDTGTASTPSGSPAPSRSGAASVTPSPAATGAGRGGGNAEGTAKSALRPLVAAAQPDKSDGIATQHVVIDDGHVDAIAGKMVDGKLRALFKDSRNPGDIVWREPSSVVVHVKPQAKEKVPDSGTYAFLGKPGSDFWLIPQVQKQGVVWAGWNTEALGGGDLKGPLDMKLTKVSGPGPVAVWETAGLGGAQVLYNSGDSLPDSQKVGLGVHAHANWGFGEQGVYKLTFQLSGTLPSGRTATDTRTYTFAVGDVDPAEVTPGGSGDGGSGGGTGGSTGGATDGGSSNGTSTGGSGSSSGATGGGGTGGSLAHTGSVPAEALAGAAGALVLGGAAAVGMSRAARRRTPAARHGD
ncbi:TIGR03773 family transporter-associated surface protein [Streptomyces sp. LaPpAH-108]|uniref:TIGR03773 family transporter-associated surface protein n=1 Tax=Streptomyces sp. LaPpAH-108 TaxID=1155714 RepID=UPI0003A9F968|nr:TIGR03773 family transporter-associated surface protein [Streptomyces sp. LaPpAH-108]